jgi:addiction module RelE/StbE family toxin
VNAIRFSNQIYEKIHFLKKKDKRLFYLIEKKLELLIINENHPSLRKHKLSGKMNNLWSISINKSIRMVYIDMENEYYFVDIGTHDQVYKK